MGKRFNTGVQIALVSIACLASITLATRRTRHVVDALLADSRRMLHLGAQRVHVGGMPVKMTSHAHSVQLAKFPCTQAWLLVTTAHVDWWLQQMEAAVVSARLVVSLQMEAVHRVQLGGYQTSTVVVKFVCTAKTRTLVL